MHLNRCIGCMEETEGYPCPHCGFDIAKEQPEYALPYHHILHGRYLVGRVLGQGGFGLTYVGWDLALNVKVAIKEYYPGGQVFRSRSMGLDLHWNTSDQAKLLREEGMSTFLREARKMARTEAIPEVVRVKDTFAENGTAYIVMAFVEGQTLKKLLETGGIMTWESASKIFLPAIDAMEKVHRAGIIHRDLSPDNLMIRPDGQVQILDLGAAKDLNINSGVSSMQVIKGGFSPVEQYGQSGGSGPWTDVYAMAATIYYSLTGVLPPAAVDRMGSDTLRWDLPQLSVLPKPVLNALQKAMVLTPQDRTQTMGEFLKQLKGIPEQKTEAKAEKKPASGGSKKSSPKYAAKRKKKKSVLSRIGTVLLWIVAACMLGLLTLWGIRSYQEHQRLLGIATAEELAKLDAGPMTYAEFAAADDFTDVCFVTYVQKCFQWKEGTVELFCQGPDGAYLIQTKCTEENSARLLPGTKIQVAGRKESIMSAQLVTSCVFKFIDDGDAYIAPALDVTAMDDDVLLTHENEFVCFKGMTVEPCNSKNEAFQYGISGDGSDGYPLYFKASKNGVARFFCVSADMYGPGSELYEAVKALQVGQTIDLEGFLTVEGWQSEITPTVTGIKNARDEYLLKEEQTEWSDGTSYTACRYFYREDGQLERMESYDMDGTLLGESKYTYSDTGVPLMGKTEMYHVGEGGYYAEVEEEYVYKDIDNPSRRTTTYYDYWGNKSLCVIETFNQEGVPTSYISYSYNENGDCTASQEKTYDERGTQVRHTLEGEDISYDHEYENEYDEHGNLISSILLNRGGEWGMSTTHVYVYDEEGRILTDTETRHEKSGREETDAYWAYDGIYQTTYEYDERGNVVKKTWLPDTESIDYNGLETTMYTYSDDGRLLTEVILLHDYTITHTYIYEKLEK